MNESGGGWDERTKMVTVSQTTLNDVSMIHMGKIQTKLESDSDDCQEVAALTTTSSQVSSSSVKSMKAKKMDIKRARKSNALPSSLRIDRASKSNTKPSPACASDDTDV
ncbi:hypothetical protein U9M48_030720 [Paspalum notatum var. saurae]|uniref:Uncharacterized protein n=1 Tax=Paspalum notatum var. saurae TaxID=547442 RepID=A0AAQ3U1G5_PASNO